MAAQDDTSPDSGIETSEGGRAWAGLRPDTKAKAEEYEKERTQAKPSPTPSEPSPRQPEKSRTESAPTLPKYPQSVPGAETQAKYGTGRLSGLATWFHYNPDGSKDKDDPNPISAFGYHLDDKSLQGVAVPVDILESTFGKFTTFDYTTGTLVALNTPEARAIRDRIKSSSVTVTASDGGKYVFPIVDIQGSLKGNPGHVLDLTYGAAHAMGLTDNAQVSYDINPGAGADWAAAENTHAAPDSVLSRYKEQYPEESRGRTDNDLLDDIGSKYYPGVPPEKFAELARLPGGTEPVEKYLDKDRTPIEAYRARFPQYADMNDQSLTQAIWDRLSKDQQDRYTNKSFRDWFKDPIASGFDNFRREFAPSSWDKTIGHFLESAAGGLLTGLPQGRERIGGFQKTFSDIVSSIPGGKEMQKAWDNIPAIMGGPLAQQGYDASRKKYEQFWGWIKQKAAEEQQRQPQNPDIAQRLGSAVGQAVGQTPAAIVSWGPLAEAGPVPSILWGTLFELGAGYGEEKQRGEVSPLDVGGQGFTRALQGAIFHSPAGKIASGFLMAIAGAESQEAQNWLEGKPENSVDEHLTQMTLDFAMAALFKDEPHRPAVQEEINQAKVAQLLGDALKAKEHLDRAGVLMTEDEQKQTAQGVQDIVEKQAGEAVDNPFAKKGEKPSAEPPKYSTKAYQTEAAAARRRVEAERKKEQEPPKWSEKAYQAEASKAQARIEAERKKEEAPLKWSEKAYQGEISASRSALQRERAKAEVEAEKPPELPKWSEKAYKGEISASRSFLQRERARAEAEAKAKEESPESPELHEPEQKAPSPAKKEEEAPELPRPGRARRLKWEVEKDPETGHFKKVTGTLKPEFEPKPKATRPEELTEVLRKSVEEKEAPAPKLPEAEALSPIHDLENDPRVPPSIKKDPRMMASLAKMSPDDRPYYIRHYLSVFKEPEDTGFTSFNFGLGDIGAMLKFVFSRGERETKENGKDYVDSTGIKLSGLGLVRPAWLETWSPQDLPPSPEFAKYADPLAGGVTPAQAMRASLVRENMIMQRQREQTAAIWTGQQQLEDKLRFDPRNISKREHFWDQFSGDQLRKFAAEDWSDTGDDRVDAMGAVYRNINDRWREFDLRNDNRFDMTRGMFSNVVKDANDLKDLVEQAKSMRIDPENIDPQTWHNILDALPKLKTRAGKPVELKTYNPEKLSQMRGDESRKMGAKSDMIQRGAGYILGSDEASDWAKAHWPRITGPGGKSYWVEPSAFSVYKNATSLSKFETGNKAWRLAGALPRSAQAVKNKTLGIKLWMPFYHAGNVMLADASSRLSIAHWNWLNKTPGSGKDLVNAIANEFTLGAKGIIETTTKKDEVFEYLKNRRRWDDLTDTGKTQVAYLDKAGIGVRISQEREGQFTGFQSKRSANRLLSQAYQAFANLGPVKPWIFGEMIPHLKVATALREIKSLIESNPMLLDPKNENTFNQALLKIGDAVDTRYGEVNWKNVFWDSTLKQAIMAGYMAAGWDLGFWRMNAGAIHDFMGNTSKLDETINQLRKEAKLSPQNRRLSNRVLFAFHYNFLNAIIKAGITFAATGSVKSMMDLFYPKIGKKPNGDDDRIKTPGWADNYAQLFRYGPFKAMVANKLSPAVSAALEVVQNMDYAGNEVYSLRPIENLEDLYGRIRDAGGYVLSQVVEPMPLEGIDRADISLQDKFLTWVGLGGPAPVWTERSSLENSILDTYKRYHGGKIPREEVEERNLRREYAQALASHDDPLARSAASRLRQLDPTGKLPRFREGQSAAQTLFHKLPARYQVDYLRGMDQKTQATWWHFASKDAKALFTQGQ